ncbi:MAG: DUF2194 domain-containing protein [Candidatus Rifleibacteriota bacterium]
MPIKQLFINFLKIVLVFFYVINNQPILAQNPFKFLLIQDKNATSTQQLSYNVGRCLSDASIRFDLADQEEMCNYHAVHFQPYQSVIFLAENSSKYVFAQDLLDYVKEGGIVCFAIHAFNQSLFSEIGISLANPELIEYLDCGGIEAKQAIFRDFRLNLPEDQFSSSAINFSFSPDWQILLNYRTPLVPMLAQRKFGKGTIVFWNSAALGEKPFRGYFLFSVLRNLPLAAMSVFNVALLYLDDSPPPAYGIKEGPVYRDLGMTDIQFHLRVWQKKVFEMLREFGYRPTHVICFRYDGKIQAPFVEEVDREPFFSDFLKKAQKAGHDFSLHGYNHQSLTLGKSPSTPWKSKTDMIASTKAACKLWNKYRLKPTLSYVPPNNVIDKAGKEAIIEGFPSIRVICRAYQDSGKYSGLKRTGYLVGANNSEFSQRMMENIFSMYASRRAKDLNSGFFAGDEFGTDPEIPKILDLPRISSGYSLEGYEQLMILNGIMAHGICAHFLHPDDIYDPSKREDTWEKTLMAMRRLFIFLEKYGSFLRKMPVSKYLIEFKKYLFSKTTIASNGPKNLTIVPDKRKFYYVFSNKGRPYIENATIISEVEPGKVFLIQADSTENIIIRNN